MANRLLIIFLAGSFSALHCWHVCASSPEPSPAAIEAESGLRDHVDEPPTVTIDLIAVNKDSQPITDLKPEELRVFADKQELTIKSLLPAIDEPLTIGLFFDGSGSRRADRFISDEARLVSELLHSLWREGDIGFVVLFSNEIVIPPHPTKDLKQIDEKLELIPQALYVGPTSLYDAITIAEPLKFATLPGRKIYLVFSDFDDNGSKHKPDDVVEAAHQAGVVIFPVLLRVNFDDGHRGTKVRKIVDDTHMIADRTGGQVIIPPSGKELATTLKKLSAELSGAYRITFVAPPTPSQAPHKHWKLHIETTRGKVKLLYPRL